MFRGMFAATQAAYSYLVRATNPHVLMLSPPLNLHPAWFADHCAYTISKYGMSMCVLGMAEEFRSKGIAINALWPRTMTETAASNIIGVASEGCRTADIMADAAHAILTRTSDQCTGRFLLDARSACRRGLPRFREICRNSRRGADQRSLCNVTATKQLRLLIFRGSNVNTLKCRASGTARCGDRSKPIPHPGACTTSKGPRPAIT